MNQIPFPRSYWVIPGQLLAGYFPGSKDPVQESANMEGLIAVGIRHVINLMEESELDHHGEPFRPYQERLKSLAAMNGINVTWERIPIRDVSVPSRDVMVMILDSIDRALSRQRPVYVHCWGGKGRTGTVVGCYLIRHGVSKGVAVMKTILEMRRNDSKAQERSPETKEQCEFVFRWKPLE